MASATKFLPEQDLITTLHDNSHNEWDERDHDNGLGASGMDVRDMSRMGKTQEFRVSNREPRRKKKKQKKTCLTVQRSFRPLAALSFSAVLQATWEFILM